MSYICMRRDHFILLSIDIGRVVVNVLDSRHKAEEDYEDITAMLKK